MTVQSGERKEVRPVVRAFGFLIAALLLLLCARSYPGWVVSNFYHPEELNYWFWVIYIPLFSIAAYFLFVAAFGLWAPRPEASRFVKISMLVSAILVSAIVVVAILAWDFRQS